MDSCNSEIGALAKREREPISELLPPLHFDFRRFLPNFF